MYIHKYIARFSRCTRTVSWDYQCKWVHLKTHQPIRLGAISRSQYDLSITFANTIHIYKTIVEWFDIEKKVLIFRTGVICRTVNEKALYLTFQLLLFKFNLFLNLIYLKNGNHLITFICACVAQLLLVYWNTWPSLKLLQETPASISFD